VVAQQQRRGVAECVGHERPLAGVHDQVRHAVVGRDPADEQHAVVRQVGEFGVGRSERRRIRRMSVNDASDVRAPLVYLRVQDGLEMHALADVVVVGVEVDGDHVRRGHLAERDTLALDVDRALVGAARADVAERQVLVAVHREDPACPGHLLGDRRVVALARRPVRSASLQRHVSLRWVGG
jgi:hypothetical protein